MDDEDEDEEFQETEEKHVSKTTTQPAGSTSQVNARPDVVGDRSARPDLVPPMGGPDVVEGSHGKAKVTPQVVQDAVHWSDDEFGDDDDDVNIEDLNLDDEDD